MVKQRCRLQKSVEILPAFSWNFRFQRKKIVKNVIFQAKLRSRYGSKSGCKIATPVQALCESLKDQKISVLIPLLFSALSCFCSYLEWNKKHLICFGCLHLRVLRKLMPNKHGVSKQCFWRCCPSCRSQGEGKQTPHEEMVLARLRLLSVGTGISGSSTSNTACQVLLGLRSLSPSLSWFKTGWVLPDFILTPCLVHGIAEQDMHCSSCLTQFGWNFANTEPGGERCELEGY